MVSKVSLVYWLARQEEVANYWLFFSRLRESTSAWRCTAVQYSKSCRIKIYVNLSYSCPKWVVIRAAARRGTGYC